MGTSLSATGKRVLGLDTDLQPTQRKAFVKSVSDKAALFWKVLLVMIVLDMYYIFVYVFMSYFCDVIGERVKLIYAQSELHFYPILMLNTLRENVMKTGMSVFNSVDQQSMAGSYANSTRLASEEVLRVSSISMCSST